VRCEPWYPRLESDQTSKLRKLRGKSVTGGKAMHDDSSYSADHACTGTGRSRRRSSRHVVRGSFPSGNTKFSWQLSG